MSRKTIVESANEAFDILVDRINECVRALNNHSEKMAETRKHISLLQNRVGELEARVRMLQASEIARIGVKP